MTRIILTAGFLISAAGFAADPPGFKLYSAAELKRYRQELPGKLNDKKLASQKLDDFGSHSTQVSHREGPGEAEVHDTDNDLFVVQSGQATLVVGGKVESPRTISAGEIRGPSISGGEKKVLKPGDIAHIPAKVPHQLLIDQGKEFTYFVMKTK